MNNILNDDGLNLLFREARTHSAWLNKPVADETLRQLYDLMKWAPTSANCNPARIVFLRTKEAKERLVPALSPGNVDKVISAPVTAIIACDLNFYEKLPTLFPHNPGMRDHFASAPELVDTTARRNSSLQGAYLILAARAWGSIADRCPASITRRSTRSFSEEGKATGMPTKSSSRKVTSNRTSCATWDTAMLPISTRAARASISTRRARFL
jgi:hypothetical protein